jgi:hypothetical protein
MRCLDFQLLQSHCGLVIQVFMFLVCVVFIFMFLVILVFIFRSTRQGGTATGNTRVQTDKKHTA